MYSTNCPPPSNWFYNVDKNNQKPYIITNNPAENLSLYQMYNSSSATLPASNSIQYNAPVDCSDTTPSFIGAIYGACPKRK